MNFRKIAPPIQLPENINLPKPIIFKLKNGIEVHNIISGEQEVILLELCFKAGRWYENQPQLSHYTHALIKEGTEQYLSQEIAEKLEFYGATLKVFAGFDYCTISVSTLSKFLEPVLAIVQHILENACFPEEELNIYRNNVLQEFEINQSKHEYVATKTFGEKLWGSNHPYGYPTRISDSVNLSVSDLKAYFKKQYCPQNLVLFVAGKTSFDIEKVLNKYLGTWQNEQGVLAIENSYVQQSNIGNYFIEDKKAHQVSVRMGAMVLSRTHEEYVAFYVMNTILGGYFGSRLMTNIREDKGYTYGIYSTVVNMVHGSYFYISTEVGKAVWKPCENEIFTEIERLKTELVSDSELMMVKNYLAGYLLSMIDGGFNRLSAWKDLHFQGLNADYFNSFAKAINNISTTAIKTAAQTYLNTDEMLKVAVGDIE